jgi:hypothetical protein
MRLIDFESSPWAGIQGNVEYFGFFIFFMSRVALSIAISG